MKLPIAGRRRDIRRKLAEGAFVASQGPRVAEDDIHEDIMKAQNIIAQRREDARAAIIDGRIKAQSEAARALLAALSAPKAPAAPPKAPTWRVDVATCEPILYADGHPKAGQHIKVKVDLPDGETAMTYLYRRELVLSYGRLDTGRHVARWGQMHRKTWDATTRADIVIKVGEDEARRLESIFYPGRPASGAFGAPESAEAKRARLMAAALAD